MIRLDAFSRPPPSYPPPTFSPRFYGFTYFNPPMPPSQLTCAFPRPVHDFYIKPNISKLSPSAERDLERLFAASTERLYKDLPPVRLDLLVDCGSIPLVPSWQTLRVIDPIPFNILLPHERFFISYSVPILISLDPEFKTVFHEAPLQQESSIKVSAIEHGQITPLGRIPFSAEDLRSFNPYISDTSSWHRAAIRTDFLSILRFLIIANRKERSRELIPDQPIRVAIVGVAHVFIEDESSSQVAEQSPIEDIPPQEPVAVPDDALPEAQNIENEEEGQSKVLVSIQNALLCFPIVGWLVMLLRVLLGKPAFIPYT